MPFLLVLEILLPLLTPTVVWLVVGDELTAGLAAGVLYQARMALVSAAYLRRCQASRRGWLVGLVLGQLASLPFAAAEVLIYGVLLAMVGGYALPAMAVLVALHVYTEHCRVWTWLAAERAWDKACSEEAPPFDERARVLTPEEREAFEAWSRIGY